MIADFFPQFRIGNEVNIAWIPGIAPGILAGFSPRPFCLITTGCQLGKITSFREENVMAFKMKCYIVPGSLVLPGIQRCCRGLSAWEKGAYDEGRTTLWFD